MCRSSEAKVILPEVENKCSPGPKRYSSATVTCTLPKCYWVRQKRSSGNDNNDASFAADVLLRLLPGNSLKDLHYYCCPLFLFVSGKRYLFFPPEGLPWGRHRDIRLLLLSCDRSLVPFCFLFIQELFLSCR